MDQTYADALKETHDDRVLEAEYGHLTVYFDGKFPVRYKFVYAFNWDGLHLSSMRHRSMKFEPTYPIEDVGIDRWNILRFLAMFYEIPEAIERDMLELIIDREYLAKEEYWKRIRAEISQDES